MLPELEFGDAFDVHFVGPVGKPQRASTRNAVFGATTLIMAISARAALFPTVSIMYAAFRVSSRACSISIRDFAISARIVPCSAIGFPKATRDCTRRHIASSARSAAPMHRMQ
jgi:hypothetical protein